MPVKDTAAKLFFKNKTIAADICNAIIYGSNVVKAEQLHEVPVELYKIDNLPDGSSKTDNRFRDMVYMCSLYADKMAGYMFLCLEAQSTVDWKMPARIMDYEARQYIFQCEEKIAKKFKKILPVITIVLNLSGQKWNGPKNLYDMFDDISPTLKKFVSNHRINILDPHSISPKKLKNFCTELKTVLNCFKYMNNKKRLMDLLLPASGEGCILSRHAAVLLNKYLNTGIEMKNCEEEVDMCKGMQEIKSAWYSEGRQEGRLEGRQEGRLEGRQEGRQEGRLEGRQEGRLEGRLEGRQEGRLEEKRKTVEKALAQGLSPSVIRKITGMTLKTIKEIQNAPRLKIN